ncbi:anoctamin-7-like [Discoglossus pictus]
MSILEVITCIAVVTNAFLMAFTSNFLTRIYYKAIFNQGLKGYIEFTLATSPFNYAMNNTPCRYQSLRNIDGSLSTHYWNLMAARLIFIVAFEHLVFFLGRFIGCIIPDVPESVANQMRRERYLAERTRVESEAQSKNPTNSNQDKTTVTTVASIYTSTMPRKKHYKWGLFSSLLLLPRRRVGIAANNMFSTLIFPLYTIRQILTAPLWSIISTTTPHH